ncbi:MarR family transcriptional regulator [Ornithinimicrobium faecis]|uniref:MarR family transcriptional regulator n=1 Tax=Ornithinimicrobium faecis TaxID=2934158 RepID=A0ABY4YQK8_9MICO|nr:MarR family transcriptional regulator [Ornithinimicrobium sp. HY1793]USQ79057.1 MarR family transcriptional regulator [Ornithinimicrobium sp. HY1793]
MTDRRDLLGQLLTFTKELRRNEDQAAAAQGVSMWQYAVLSVAAARAGLNQAEAAAMLGYSRNRIIADIDTLQEKGLLTRERAADRRANTLLITPAGLRVMRTIRADIHRGEDEILAGLTQAERDELDRLAGRISTLMTERRQASAS